MIANKTLENWQPPHLLMLGYIYSTCLSGMDLNVGYAMLVVTLLYTRVHDARK